MGIHGYEADERACRNSDSYEQVSAGKKAIETGTEYAERVTEKVKRSSPRAVTSVDEELQALLCLDGVGFEECQP
jgi:hypothetical protein